MSSSGIQCLNETIIAATNIGANRFIGFDGNYPAAGEGAFGIAHFDVNLNEPVTVTTLGSFSVYAGGTIVVGAEVEIGTAGAVVTKSVGITVGRARSESTGDGDLIEVFIIPS